MTYFKHNSSEELGKILFVKRFSWLITQLCNKHYSLLCPLNLHTNRPLKVTILVNRKYKSTKYHTVMFLLPGIVHTNLAPKVEHMVHLLPATKAILLTSHCPHLNKRAI
uniref:Uncharacterized protein n=1 Tax=Cacopsylla melanoneura TaxID=428564 RepID=A0A8D8UVX8_9HEMI